MDGYVLMFWQPGPGVRLTPAEIGRDLTWGEEVEGLIDLPVREIIDRLKTAFPTHQEQSGVLIGHTQDGSFEATWTWQYVKVVCHDLDGQEHESVIKAVGLSAYDPQQESTDE